jgi:branched-chain amino acid transport system substrate-binding protein
VEQGIRLALSDSDQKAEKFTIKYVPLDATDETGAFLPNKIQENARIAAHDDKTAVFIGDFSSSASIESIPILSGAGVPQISPASTRVGLTVGDALSDTNEPDQYYRGAHNFVRIIPNDDVQAAALGSLMKHDGCHDVAVIYDGGDYSQGLSVLMSLIGRPHRVFSEDVRPNERSVRYTGLARKAKARGADCFLYMGDDNPNTFGIYQAFASKLRGAKLYGTDGVSESSLTDENGIAGTFAPHVRLMVPPRDLSRYTGFRQQFRSAYNGVTPDPYAVYGYEAMRLALDAIRASGSGTRADILAQLRSPKQRDSLLGSYAIDGSGDTNLIDYDVSRFENGERGLHRAVEQGTLKKNVEVLRRRK